MYGEVTDFLCFSFLVGLELGILLSLNWFRHVL